MLGSRSAEGDRGHVTPDAAVAIKALDERVTVCQIAAPLTRPLVPGAGTSNLPKHGKNPPKHLDFIGGTEGERHRRLHPPFTTTAPPPPPQLLFNQCNCKHGSGHTPTHTREDSHTSKCLINTPTCVCERGFAAFNLMQKDTRKRSESHQTSQWQKGIQRPAATGTSVDACCCSFVPALISAPCCSHYRPDAFKSPEGLTRLHFDQLNENPSLIRRLKEKKKTSEERLDASLCFINSPPRERLQSGEERRKEGSLRFPPVFVASSLNSNGIFFYFPFFLPDVS